MTMRHVKASKELELSREVHTMIFIASSRNRASASPTHRIVVFVELRVIVPASTIERARQVGQLSFCRTLTTAFTCMHVIL